MEDFRKEGISVVKAVVYIFFCSLCSCLINSVMVFNFHVSVSIFLGWVAYFVTLKSVILGKRHTYRKPT